MTRLVTVAHGTRDGRGNEVARALTMGAGALLGLPAVGAYVELQAPLFTDVMIGNDDPVIVVPLLLSIGHHVAHDLPVAISRSRGPVDLAGPLGPSQLLAAALCARLREAGAVPGQPVVLAAAGSRDPRADADLALAGDLLASVWGAEVAVATLTGRGTRLGAVVTPDVAVVPYLLAHGYFADRVRVESRGAGAVVVAGVLGAHPFLMELAAQRAGESVGARIVA